MREYLYKSVLYNFYSNNYCSLIVVIITVSKGLLMSSKQNTSRFLPQKSTGAPRSNVYSRDKDNTDTQHEETLEFNYTSNNNTLNLNAQLITPGDASTAHNFEHFTMIFSLSCRITRNEHILVITMSLLFFANNLVCKVLLMTSPTMKHVLSST